MVPKQDKAKSRDIKYFEIKIKTYQTNGGCLKINNHEEKNETAILKNTDYQK